MTSSTFLNKSGQYTTVSGSEHRIVRVNQSKKTFTKRSNINTLGISTWVEHYCFVQREDDRTIPLLECEIVAKASNFDNFSQQNLIQTSDDYCRLRDTSTGVSENREAGNYTFVSGYGVQAERVTTQKTGEITCITDGESRTRSLGPGKMSQVKIVSQDVANLDTGHCSADVRGVVFNHYELQTKDGVIVDLFHEEITKVPPAKSAE